MDRELSEPLIAAHNRPWSENEFPILAKWIEANNAVLDRFVADSGREKFYTPLYYNRSADEPGSMFNAGGRSELRPLLMLLLARASLALKAARVEDAWRECLVVHRFARQIGQGPFYIDFLVAVIVEECAAAFDGVIAANAGLSCEQARRFQSGLDHLSPMPQVACVRNYGDRLH